MLDGGDGDGEERERRHRVSEHRSRDENGPGRAQELRETLFTVGEEDEDAEHEGGDEAEGDSLFDARTDDADARSVRTVGTVGSTARRWRDR